MSGTDSSLPRGWLGTPMRMVMFPKLPELRECLDNALRARVGFLGSSCAGSGVGLDDPGVSRPTQDIL